MTKSLHSVKPSAESSPPARLDARPGGSLQSVTPLDWAEMTEPFAHPPARWAWITRFSVRPLLVALDVVAIAVGIVILELAVDGPGFDTPITRTLTFGVCLLLGLWTGGLYRSRLSLSALDDLPTLVGRALAAAALSALAQIAWAELTSGVYDVNWSYLGGAMVVTVTVALCRALGYAVVRRARAHRLVAHRTLILGAGRVGSQVADVLRAHPEYGLHPIGFLDADPPDTDPPRILPVLGGPEAFTHVLLQGGVRAVIVAFSSMKESQMVSLIRTCDRLSCELFVVPRLFELHQVESSMDTAWGFPLVRLRRATYRSRAWGMKRAMDVLVSGVTIVLLAPLLGLISLAVRLDGKGDILFRQERVGVDGHHFELMKFRSLRPASEAESQTTWNIGDDPRLTRVGRFLRSTSLDELPQLYNILRGDMSLVGPRPERPHFVSQFQSLYPSYEARHRVPSGLTGWAQVHGLRGDTSIADRARFDNYYIENWSLWLDIKIILRTFSAVLLGAGR
ncbi:Undecaprenyl-phosphate glucose phosphotransferase [Blastococcus aggregatus]|uniref:Undecaprenyl-phosphate glucose phosphotransferase n=1 Tax=Blastococcus aggregatus TaxID=38502 RepID=A0A285V2D2_9ACTN|nr:sugar transferase [Blastococcus aggregatus]SOC47738.1 Undecaprenyl-phosphate glucose phosphotransferase [Blastococcus aggregatus]